ncbi:hypothetical protein SAMN02910384_02163 [Pseudobutyrivibrio sp. ACV-2]|uniref:hypothetical protein n=1 Tax=Pseudobutyrivibrio sp. ACV-2 TaxID=1520801 RepID=UPI00089D9564|nr:hypothetical protein [Pseudobutyrivibrio sp. ACV-2]SEA72241.1 hypothetical protein SAMN02910384_02163 [Pseudobutyrivibrio sp. ACV-2]
MIKKIITIFCVLLCVLSFTGCKDSNNAELASENEESVTGTPGEYKHYAASAEWSNYSVSDRAVQVDDVLYVPGMTLEEALKKVEESEVDYTYDFMDDKEPYDPNRLVDYKDRVMIYRDGNEWIELDVYNCYDEETPISQLPIVNVCTFSAATYSHYLNGMSYQEILEMSKDDVIALAEENFESVDFEETEDSITDENHELIHCTLLKYTYYPRTFKNAEWTGYYISTGTTYLFYIDPDTSKVISFWQNQVPYCSSSKLN